MGERKHDYHDSLDTNVSNTALAQTSHLDTLWCIEVFAPKDAFSHVIETFQTATQVLET